jgi:hypothetical protein
MAQIKVFLSDDESFRCDMTQEDAIENLKQDLANPTPAFMGFMVDYGMQTRLKLVNKRHIVSIDVLKE